MFRRSEPQKKCFAHRTGDVDTRLPGFKSCSPFQRHIPLLSGLYVVKCLEMHSVSDYTFRSIVNPFDSRKTWKRCWETRTIIGTLSTARTANAANKDCAPQRGSDGRMWNRSTRDEGWNKACSLYPIPHHMAENGIINERECQALRSRYVFRIVFRIFDIRRILMGGALEHYNALHTSNMYRKGSGFNRGAITAESMASRHVTLYLGKTIVENTRSKPLLLSAFTFCRVRSTSRFLILVLPAQQLSQ